MVEAVFIEIEKIKIELRAGPVKGNFPDTIEAFISSGTRDSRTSRVGPLALGSPA